MTHPLPSIETSKGRSLTYCWAGCVGYDTAYQWQLKLHQARREQRLPDCFVMLTHPPTYTAGTRTRREHLPSPQILQKHRAQLHLSDRGGSITFHGPGQLVGYGIVHLECVQYDLHKYVWLLEEALLRVLGQLGVAGERHPLHTGIWVAQAKVASIGIKVMRRVTLHGFALNMNNSLSPLQDIIPCGIEGAEATSLSTLGITPPPMSEVATRLALHLADLLGFSDCQVYKPEEMFQPARSGTNDGYAT